MFLYHGIKNSHGTIIMGFIVAVSQYYHNNYCPTLVHMHMLGSYIYACSYNVPSL